METTTHANVSLLKDETIRLKKGLTAKIGSFTLKTTYKEFDTSGSRRFLVCLYTPSQGTWKRISEETASTLASEAEAQAAAVSLPTEAPRAYRVTRQWIEVSRRTGQRTTYQTTRDYQVTSSTQ